jgi:hypothetical protein
VTLAGGLKVLVVAHEAPVCPRRADELPAG